MKSTRSNALLRLWFSQVVLALFASLSIAVSVSAQEGISVVKGPYEVFYSTFNTSFLSAETAAATGFVRAKNRVLVNISIRQRDVDNKTKTNRDRPVAAASIAGSAYNLLHRKQLEFKEIREPGAIYYLAELKVSNDDEFFDFQIDVSPADSTETIAIAFKRRFFLN